MRIIPSLTLLVVAGGLCLAADNNKQQNFNAYTDCDLCARLMLGPITQSRVECSKNMHKQGSEAVLVRLRDNSVFSVNKPKLLDPLVSRLVIASGEPKEKDGTMKLLSTEALDWGAVAVGSPDRKLLDVRQSKMTGEGAKLHEKIRHELATMPYISEFDFISFNMVGRHVILTGWTIRPTNRSTAQNLVKSVGGVEQVTNNIDVLDAGKFDMQIRAGARAALQRFFPRYFWGSGSAIKIIVKNSDIILLGVVASKADADTAALQCQSVRGAFRVFNMLTVEKAAPKG